MPRSRRSSGATPCGTLGRTHRERPPSRSRGNALLREVPGERRDAARRSEERRRARRTAPPRRRTGTDCHSSMRQSVNELARERRICDGRARVGASVRRPGLRGGGIGRAAKHQGRRNRRRPTRDRSGRRGAGGRELGSTHVMPPEARRLVEVALPQDRRPARRRRCSSSRRSSSARRRPASAGGWRPWRTPPRGSRPRRCSPWSCRPGLSMSRGRRPRSSASGPSPRGRRGRSAPSSACCSVSNCDVEDLVLRVDLQLVVVLVVAGGSGSIIISTVSFVQSLGCPVVVHMSF